MIAAGGLLLVFLMTPFVEAFHHHRQAKTSTEQAGKVRSTDHLQFKVYNFCKICDYLRHSDHQHASTQPALYTIYLPVIILKSRAIEPRIIPALILSYTNKGPPVV